mmetsp:Transcript_18310/g.69309  ORF Transcript_18310/g.69309 Transcript_18310/m.69309 type:complete len:308 (+) Transcript_18310:800-1723(+)
MPGRPARHLLSSPSERPLTQLVSRRKRNSPFLTESEAAISSALMSTLRRPPMASSAVLRLGGKSSSSSSRASRILRMSLNTLTVLRISWRASSSRPMAAGRTSVEKASFDAPKRALGREERFAAMSTRGRGATASRRTVALISSRGTHSLSTSAKEWAMSTPSTTLAPPTTSASGTGTASERLRMPSSGITMDARRPPLGSSAMVTVRGESDRSSISEISATAAATAASSAPSRSMKVTTAAVEDSAMAAGSVERSLERDSVREQLASAEVTASLRDTSMVALVVSSAPPSAALEIACATALRAAVA